MVFSMGDIADAVEYAAVKGETIPNAVLIHPVTARVMSAAALAGPLVAGYEEKDGQIVSVRTDFGSVLLIRSELVGTDKLWFVRTLWQRRLPDRDTRI